MAEPETNRTAAVGSSAADDATKTPPPPPPPPPPPFKAESSTLNNSSGVGVVGDGGGIADDDDGGGEEDDMILVSEFPPPPYYYALASSSRGRGRLTPPEIPHRAFRVAAKRVRIERRRVRTESERMRLLADQGGDGTTTITTTTTTNDDDDDDNDDDSIDVDDPNETPVIACFGEIVEDPTLLSAVDEGIGGEGCHDPAVVRENVRALNRDVLNGFLRLVRALADDPNDNRKLRDELSHNLFLMLQEANKFREHQARELLIKTLEMQLKRRREGLALLREDIKIADMALTALREFGG